MEIWDSCLEGNLEAEVRSRIIGCKAQMELFKFFYGINLGTTIYSITDNLSKALQAESISAMESQETAKFAIATLEGMGSLENADSFYDTVKLKAEKFPCIEEPTLPRKRRAPNYRTLEQYFVIQGLPSNAEAYHPSSAKEYFRAIYLDVLDSIVVVIKERFEQQSFKAYMMMESFLMKSIDGSCVEKEIDFLKENYGDDDIKIDLLRTEKEVWRVIFTDLKPTCFKDILTEVKLLSKSQKMMIPNCLTICKLIIVNLATSCTAERLFSTAGRLKTWLRATMKSKRFNSLAILNNYKSSGGKLFQSGGGGGKIGLRITNFYLITHFI